MADARYKYKDYEESDAVRQANDSLTKHNAAKPGNYQSKWQQGLEDALNKIQNRDKFTYDLNGDALYQQYKDQYVNQGRLAMQDTMGQAAALTGGYGNSYAQSVGQQAYQGYLQQLNNQIPELYQIALNQYNREGEDLYNQYALLSDREQQDYGRYRDTVSDWNTERDYLYNLYNTERGYDYGKYTDDRNFDYGTWSDQREYDYRADRDAVADAQWQKEFDEAMRQYNQNYAYQQARDQASDEQWKKSYSESKRQFNVSNGITEYEIDDEFDYSTWGAGDWDAYFSDIRLKDGAEAASKELNVFVKQGLIPKEFLTTASIAARGKLGR